MQHAGHQYGPGALPSSQQPPPPPYEPPPHQHQQTSPPGGISLTSSLRQWRKKDLSGIQQHHHQLPPPPAQHALSSPVDHHLSAVPSEGDAHVARVAPQAHYSRPGADLYRFPPQYPDYGLQAPVKYSEIVENVPQDLKMCGLQQQPSPHLKSPYQYPANFHHPQMHHAYTQKESQMPMQYPPQCYQKFNMQQPPQYNPPSDSSAGGFLATLSKINPRMAQSIMGDPHLREPPPPVMYAADQNHNFQRMYGQSTGYRSALSPPQQYGAGYSRTPQYQVPGGGVYGKDQKMGYPQCAMEYSQHYQNRYQMPEYYPQKPEVPLQPPEPAVPSARMKQFWESWGEDEIETIAETPEDKGNDDPPPPAEQVFVLNSDGLSQYVQLETVRELYENGSIIFKAEAPAQGKINVLDHKRILPEDQQVVNLRIVEAEPPKSMPTISDLFQEEVPREQTAEVFQQDDAIETSVVEDTETTKDEDSIESQKTEVDDKTNIPEEDEGSNGCSVIVSRPKTIEEVVQKITSKKDAEDPPRTASEACSPKIQDNVESEYDTSRNGLQDDSCERLEDNCTRTDDDCISHKDCSALNKDCLRIRQGQSTIENEKDRYDKPEESRTRCEDNRTRCDENCTKFEENSRRRNDSCTLGVEKRTRNEDESTRHEDASTNNCTKTEELNNCTNIEVPSNCILKNDKGSESDSSCTMDADNYIHEGSPLTPKNMHATVEEDRVRPDDSPKRVENISTKPEDICTINEGNRITNGDSCSVLDDVPAVDKDNSSTTGQGKVVLPPGTSNMENKYAVLELDGTILEIKVAVVDNRKVITVVPYTVDSDNVDMVLSEMDVSAEVIIDDEGDSTDRPCLSTKASRKHFSDDDAALKEEAKTEKRRKRRATVAEDVSVKRPKKPMINSAGYEGSMPDQVEEAIFETKEAVEDDSTKPTAEDKISALPAAEEEVNEDTTKPSTESAVTDESVKTLEQPNDSTKLAESAIECEVSTTSDFLAADKSVDYHSETEVTSSTKTHVEKKRLTLEEYTNRKKQAAPETNQKVIDANEFDIPTRSQELESPSSRLEIIKEKNDLLMRRFLNYEKLTAEEMRKVKEIIHCKRMLVEMNKVRMQRLTEAKPPVNERLDGETEGKLQPKKVPKAKKRFKNLYAGESETEEKEKDGDYQAFQTKAQNGVPKIIIKRRPQMQPYVRLERSAMIDRLARQQYEKMKLVR